MKKPQAPQRLVPAGKAERWVSPAQTGAAEPVPRIDGVVIGQVVGLDEVGQPLVDFDLAPLGVVLTARSTVALDADCVGRDVALLFEQGDPWKPVVMGLLWTPDPPSEQGTPGAEAAGHIEVSADGERLTLSAEREIVLRCGKASLTLTRAGKVLIRGEYVLSRSSGVNRIKGGSVQIN